MGLDPLITSVKRKVSCQAPVARDVRQQLHSQASLLCGYRYPEWTRTFYQLCSTKAALEAGQGALPVSIRIYAAKMGVVEAVLHSR